MIGVALCTAKQLRGRQVNGQQFLDPGVDITYFAAPALSFIQPATGPAAGNTYVVASGVNFRNGDNVTCSFGGSVVGANRLSDGQIECFSPPYDVMDAP